MFLDLIRLIRRVVTHQRPHSCQGPHVPLLDGFHTNPEHCRALGIAQLLQMLQDKNLPVAVGQLGQQRSNSGTKLSSQEMLRGTRLDGRKPLGKLHGRSLRELQRCLLADGSLGCLKVLSMYLNESIPGNLPQPWVKRESWALQVLRQFSASANHRVLYHVRGVNPTGQPFVQPGRDHTPQTRPVPGKEFPFGRPVSVTKPSQ